MKEIKLSQNGKNRILNLVALVDDEDFEHINKFRWCVTFSKTTQAFYACRTVKEGKPKTILMHRVILNILDKKIQGDHKDHNTLNNTRDNLRVATFGENLSNRKSAKNSVSKYLGVDWHKRDKKWRAKIRSNGKTLFLGLFNDEHDAANAYNNAAIKLHGEFANLNQVA